jgi:hypothetical protein
MQVKFSTQGRKSPRVLVKVSTQCRKSPHVLVKVSTQCRKPSAAKMRHFEIQVKYYFEALRYFLFLSVRQKYLLNITIFVVYLGGVQKGGDNTRLQGVIHIRRLRRADGQGVLRFFDTSKMLVKNRSIASTACRQVRYVKWRANTQVRPYGFYFLFLYVIQNFHVSLPNNS